MGFAAKAFNDTAGLNPNLLEAPATVAGEKIHAPFLKVFSGAGSASLKKESGDSLLAQLAPIVESYQSPNLLNLTEKINTTPFDEIVKAQTAALALVWEAFEKADSSVSPLSSNGRADIGFTRENLEKLSLDIGRYLHVAQTQLPIIFPLEGESNAVTPVNIFWVNGGGKKLIYNPMIKFCSETQFGFMTFTKEEENGHGIKREKILALPAVGLANPMLEFALRTEQGSDMLKAFQQIMSTVNHDYFHYLTARVIAPYFAEDYNGAINLRETPLGTLLGPVESKTNQAPAGKKKFWGLKAENSTLFNNRYYNESYLQFKAGSDSGSDGYEFNSLHLHNAIYQGYLHAGPEGEKLLASLRSYFARLKEITVAPEEPGKPRIKIEEEAKLYFSNLVYNNLMRIVPYTHPLLQECERLIDDLNISRNDVRTNINNRLVDMKEKIFEGVIGGAVEQANRESGIGIDSMMDSRLKNYKISELLRWENYMMNAGDLNILHMESQQGLQSRALSAAREFISVVQRDVQLAKWRGGLETYEALTAPKPKDPAV